MITSPRACRFEESKCRLVHVVKSQLLHKLPETIKLNVSIIATIIVTVAVVVVAGAGGW